MKDKKLQQMDKVTNQRKIDLDTWNQRKTKLRYNIKLLRIEINKYKLSMDDKSISTETR
jgi:hypothetical protein